MSTRVPLPTKGVNVLALPLTTVEGFVLSRIDGVSSVEDISLMTGIDPARVTTILERLAELGAVQLPWRVSARPPGHGPRGGLSGTLTGAAAPPVDAHFRRDPPRFDPSELDERSDLSVATRERILHAFHALEGRDLYQTLGVPRDAERATIRNAYFELSKLFHPDAYFGKSLGGYKLKLEAVFKRLTECYEVLGKAKKRRDYDDYLAVLEQSRRAQHAMESIEFTDHEINALRKAAERRAAESRGGESRITGPRPDSRESRPSDPRGTQQTPRDSRTSGRPIESRRPAPRGSDGSTPVVNSALRSTLTGAEGRRAPSVDSAPAGPTSMRPPPRPPTDSMPVSAVDTQPISNRPVLTTQERRARVRERLRQQLRPPSEGTARTSSPGNEEADADERRRGAVKGLRDSLRTVATATAPLAQLSGHLAKAQSAEAAGDVLLATHQLQQALAIDPNNAEALAAYGRLSKLVARSLADNYEKQALYEEKSSNWEAAAKSWVRVSDARPDDARAARSAADALLKARGDLHLAQKYAQRAASLPQQDPQTLATLARVYLAAGLKLNAIRELEKAAKLAPRDEVIQSLLRAAR